MADASSYWFQLLVPPRAWHFAVAQGTQEPLNRNENFKDPGPSSVRQGALNGLLCGPKADTLEQVRSASSSVAQSTEQELGEDKEECPQGGGTAHPDRRLGSTQGVCVGEDLGGALSPEPHLQRLCPHPQEASELSHILWKEMFGKSDSC